MSYVIRQWMSLGGNLWDETETARTADEAIATMQKMCGAFHGIVSDSVQEKVRSMEPGDMMKFKSSAAKITIRVKRLRA